MASFFCLLRGINVSGRKKVCMELRGLCESIGLERPPGIAATTRKWKTVNALADMASSR